MIRGKVDIPELIPLLEAEGIDSVYYGYVDRQGPQAKTLCSLCINGETVAFGYARKSPLDQLCYARGRSIALRRAFGELDTKHRRQA